MKFELVSLDGVKFSEDAYSVVLPTAAGQITVMPGHEALLSVVVPGVITIRRSKGDTEARLEHFATFGGVLEVGDDYARVLVDEATHGDDVNEAEAEKAHQAALEVRKNAKDQVELEKAQAMVDRQAVRLAVAQVRRRNRH
ncbi:MAG TPA: ATP synthase F1 subunit epsilon [Candidatus Saccharimonadales bacterium]|nr:ATP synthase F1 subunit epsilon [Candidatus Saccharimonadales bacterium]